MMLETEMTAARSRTGQGKAHDDVRNGISRRAFFKGAAAIGFSFMALGQLVGCGSGTSSTTGSTAVNGASGTPDKLTLLFNDAPTSLDPATGWDGWYTVCRGITETLVEFDSGMNLVGCLATDWKMDDDLSWRFTIRQGVKFQTGKDVTPDAVMASLRRTVGLSDRAADKIQLDSMEVDGNDLIIHSTKTVATMPGELAEPVFSIVDTDTADTTPETSGTGPYMGDSIDSMENFTLKRFDGYWGGAALVPQINNQTVTEPSSRTIALQSGDADIAWSIQASDLDSFRNDSGFQLVTCESVRMVFAFLNFKNEHLATKEVRQALSYATDREGMCNSLLSGTQNPNGTLFPSYLTYSKGVADIAQAYDMDKAAQLIADAGYEKGSDGILAKDGSSLSLRIAYYESRPELPVIAQALQDQFGKLGIGIELQLFENIDDIFGTDQFDILLYNTTTIGNGDPSYYLGLYYTSDGSENAGGYSNPDVDGIVDKMKQDLNQDERFSLAVDAQKLILADCPSIFISSPIMNLVSRADVTGIELFPVEYYGVTNKLA